MLRRFLGIWIVYWLGVALLPVQSLFPATRAAFYLQAGFVLLVALGYVAVLASLRFPRMPQARQFELPNTLILVRIALWMSLIGLACHLFDKIIIQGVSFSDGVAVARETWRQIAEQREGRMSSVFSMLGYFLGSAYFVAVVLAITQIGVMSSRQRLATLGLSFLLVIANSLLTGGRSNVLLLASFAIGAFAARDGIVFRDLFTSTLQRRIVQLLVMTAGAYTVYIFYQRAAVEEMSGVDYALDFLPFLGLKAESWYRQMLGDGPLSSLSAMLVLAGSYITHSFATVAAIIDTPQENKTIIFLHAAGILYKLGLTGAPDGDWFLSGRLPSMPGALWHQFGIAGYIFGALLLGAMGAFAKAWTACRPWQLLPLGVYVMMQSIFLLTPVLFAGDFLGFPFVAGSFVTLALISYWITARRDKNNSLPVEAGLGSLEAETISQGI